MAAMPKQICWPWWVASSLTRAREGTSLLHMRDLADSDDLVLTQQFLAQMLGLTRPSVSIVAGPAAESRASCTAHVRFWHLAHAGRAAATLDVVASKVEVICPELTARADEVIE